MSSFNTKVVGQIVDINYQLQVLTRLAKNLAEEHGCNELHGLTALMKKVQAQVGKLETELQD